MANEPDVLKGTENGYTEVTILVEGAVQADYLVGPLDGGLDGGPSYEEILASWSREAAADPSLYIEVYRQDHGHSLDYNDEGEDVCMQYETDHHPAQTFGTAKGA